MKASHLHHVSIERSAVHCRAPHSCEPSYPIPQVRKCEKPRYTLLRTIGQRRTWWGKSVPAAEVRGEGGTGSCMQCVQLPKGHGCARPYSQQVGSVGMHRSATPPCLAYHARSSHAGSQPVQVRLFAPYLVAEVTMAGSDMDMRQALGSGFRQM